ncbi:MAG: prolipoprotein diacylglyceryl transferase [Candidatus Omnitrophica bacterium]|nr:prolipoprotein diacylglyceryl transferase [Candidatus Omnitrophota bacterium]
MHPILFTIGSFTIYSYGVMLALSVLVCTYLLSRDAARYNISQDTAYDLVFWCMLWGIIGARIFYIFITWSYYSNNLMEMLMLQKGGLAWQGGFLGGTLAGVWFARRKKLFLKPVMDLVAPYIALGQSIGRIGCFFNGCCYGRSVSWGIYYPVHGARLHPTQLYETAGLFLIFLILKEAQKKKYEPGFIFILYLWLAALERFIVEFYRADHDMVWWGLSLAQYVALGVFTAGLILMRAFKK